MGKVVRGGPDSTGVESGDFDSDLQDRTPATSEAAKSMVRVLLGISRFNLLCEMNLEEVPKEFAGQGQPANQERDNLR